jgi:hypothetical protein
VLPAVREFRGREVDILFCDDDIVYDSRWAERFAGMRREHPGACIAEAGRDIPDIHATTRPQARLPRAVEAAWSLRAWLKAVARHRSRPRPLSVTSGYSDVFRGFGGVMVRPAYFREDAFQIPDVLWTVDDYWLSGHLEANRIPIWLNGDTPRHRSHKARYVDALKKFVCNGNDRQAANDACVEYFRATYGIWLPSNHSDGSSPPACNSSQENATA